MLEVLSIAGVPKKLCDSLLMCYNTSLLGLILSDKCNPHHILAFFPMLSSTK
jgi:hypothetical protein